MMLRTMDTHNIIIGCLHNAYYTYRPRTILNFFTFDFYRYIPTEIAPAVAIKQMT